MIIISLQKKQDHTFKLQKYKKILKYSYNQTDISHFSPFSISEIPKRNQKASCGKKETAIRYHLNQKLDI